MSILKIRNGSTWEEIPAGGVGVPSGGTAGQILMKSSATDYADEWADISEAGAMSKWDLLWTNASPTSAFAAQTVSLDLSGYDAVAIKVVNVSGYSESDDRRRYVIFFGIVGNRMGMSTQLRNTDNVLYTHTRYALPTTSGITFGGGVWAYSSSGTSGGTNNESCAPISIYGIKGVN